MLKMAYYNRTTATAARTTNAIIKWQPHSLLSPLLLLCVIFVYALRFASCNHNLIKPTATAQEGGGVRCGGAWPMDGGLVDWTTLALETLLLMSGQCVYFLAQSTEKIIATVLFLFKSSIPTQTKKNKIC